MKKFTKLLLVVLSVALLATALALTVSAAELKRDKEGTYLIYTPQDLVEFSSQVSNNRKMNAKLMADIDMTGVTYTPSSGYYGHFDGNGYTISNLHRTVTDAAKGEYGLLFTTLGNGYGDFIFGEIVNLTMKDCSITVTSANEVFVGALTGKCDRNDIYDCTFINVDVNLNGAAGSAAGLAVGYSCWGATRGSNSSIEYFGLTADAACSVIASGDTNYAGSFVGKHDWDPVYFHDVTTAATVTAANGYAGGVIGWNLSGNNPRFYGAKIDAVISGATVGALAGKANAPEFGLIAIENNTTLGVVGEKSNGNQKYEYYDDLATYGALPKTDDGMYVITTPEELFWFAKFYQGNNNKNRIRQEAVAILGADIDMNGKSWTPIESFRGTFDGNGYTISNLHHTVNQADNDTKHGLLFNNISNNHGAHIFGLVRNVTIADSSLTVTGDGVKYNVGGIAGQTDRGSFYNCTLKNVDISVTGNLNATTVIGGMTGWAVYAPENPGRDYVQEYINCYVDSDCTFYSNSPNTEIGGIFGTLSAECFYMNNCVVAATLSGEYRTGGLLGSITSGGNRWYMVSDCAFYGDATGSVAGGIIGYASKNGYILDSTVTGDVAGIESSGIYVGKVNDGFNVYYKRNSDGTMSVKGDKSISLYCQTRATEVGHDLRVILLADLEKIKPYASLNVEIAFYTEGGTLIKKVNGALDGSASGYQLYKSVLADGETYTADENAALFGQIITNIPNGAYNYFTVTVTDENGTSITEGSTKKTESSLEGKTFYFLGSSVTYGSNSGGVSMADLIATRNNCTTKKDAVSGTTLVDNGSSSYVQRLINSTVFDKTADVDHFIVQLSTNDAGQGKPMGTVSTSKNLNDFDTSTVIGAMEYIICYVKETWGCEVSFYTGTCYNNNQYVQMIMALYDLQEKWDIGVIDMFFDAEMSSLPVPMYNAYMSDTVHPNRDGYEFWWTPVFEEHLKSYEYN